MPTKILPGPYTVLMEMESPVRVREMIHHVATLREASEVAREWLNGGNAAGESLGVSQTGRDCGRVTQSKSGKEVARISYNGRVWEPGAYPTPEITDLD